MNGIASKARRALRALALSVLIAAAAQGCSGGGKADEKAAPPPPKPSRSRDVSGVTLKALDGTEKRISDYSGKMLVVTFFTTWHSSAKEMVPIMNELGRKFRNNFTVIGIVTDKQSAGTIRTFMSTNDVKFDVYMDGSGAANGFGGARVVPTVYFVLRDGKIHHKIEGLKTRKTYEDIILAMFRMHL